MSKLKRGSIAFLLSLVVPGLGQIYAGQLLAGPLLGVGFLAFGFFAISEGLRFAYRTGLIFLIASSTFQLAIAIHAAFVAARHINSATVPKPKWRPCAIGAALVGLFVFAHSGSPDRLLPVRAFKMPSISMSPTLVVGDRFIADISYYKTHRPDRGDVVIFKMPTNDVLFTKRVIAVAGDSIEGTPEKTIVNGQTLSEPYAFRDTSETPDDGETFGPITIPANEIFVMGNNRNHSYDSRYFGSIDVSRVVGKALYIYYSHDDKSRIGHAIQ
jgi:signal peptidase I